VTCCTPDSRAEHQLNRCIFSLAELECATSFTRRLFMYAHLIARFLAELCVWKAPRIHSLGMFLFGITFCATSLTRHSFTSIHAFIQSLFGRAMRAGGTTNTVTQRHRRLRWARVAVGVQHAARSTWGSQELRSPRACSVVQESNRWRERSSVSAVAVIS
jgi:hypothetical protein